MSEYLQDLLKKVKYNADALEAPPAEPDLDRGSSLNVGSTKTRKPKPGFSPKPGSEHGSKAKLDLLAKSGLVAVSSSAPVSGLAPKPDVLPKPSSQPGDEAELDLPAKPGLVGEPLPFQLLRTFTRSKAAISNLIPQMKDSELRLYHYLAELTYGTYGSPADHVITYSQKEAMKATSIKSTATIVKSMNSLCKRKLLKWVRKSRKRGEVSQIKVFLPGNFQESRTPSDVSMVE